MSQSDSNEQENLVFVVLEFPVGFRGYVPLPGGEAQLERLMKRGATELGRTGDPQELARLMGGEEEGGSD